MPDPKINISPNRVHMCTPIPCSVMVKQASEHQTSTILPMSRHRDTTRHKDACLPRHNTAHCSKTYLYVRTQTILKRSSHLVTKWTACVTQKQTMLQIIPCHILCRLRSACCPEPKIVLCVYVVGQTAAKPAALDFTHTCRQVLSGNGCR